MKESQSSRVPELDMLKSGVPRVARLYYINIAALLGTPIFAWMFDGVLEGVGLHEGLSWLFAGVYDDFGMQNDPARAVSMQIVFSWSFVITLIATLINVIGNMEFHKFVFAQDKKKAWEMSLAFGLVMSAMAFNVFSNGDDAFRRLKWTITSHPMCGWVAGIMILSPLYFTLIPLLVWFQEEKEK